jgi:ribosome-associated protein
MIKVTDNISLHENEIQVDFVQASGPGGQNVNKTASQAQLRFDAKSASLPEEVRSRLFRIAKNRITAEGVLIIEAKRYRSQERNRADAVDRLVALIRAAAEVPKTRHKTQPSMTARRKRLESKQHRSKIKQMRRRIEDE